MYASPQPHGTPDRYRQGCACDECRKAWRLYHQAYRAAHPAKRKPRRKRRLHSHGTVKRYWQRCRCDRCSRAFNLWRRVVRQYPSVGDPVAALTDPAGPAFWQLVQLIPPAAREACRRRAEDRWTREQAAAPSRAGAEIARMTTRQIEALMQPDIPTPAQTRRRHLLKESA